VFWGGLAAAMIVAMGGLAAIGRHIPAKGEHAK
jgi:hypothetical protein